MYSCPDLESLVASLDALNGRLKFNHLFSSSAWKLLWDSLGEIFAWAVQWTNTKMGLKECVKTESFYSQDQYQDLGIESNSIVCILALDNFVHPCPHGISFLHQSMSETPLKKRKTARQNTGSFLSQSKFFSGSLAFQDEKRISARSWTYPIYPGWDTFQKKDKDDYGLFKLDVDYKQSLQIKTEK